MKTFKPKKTVQILSFLALENGGTLNKMKAIKLIWLLDRLHLRRYGRTITGDEYFAFKFGPVASCTRDIVEFNSWVSDDEKAYAAIFLGNFTDLDYSCVMPPDYKAISESEWECIKEVLSKYGDMSQFELSELSHSFPEWKNYEIALKTNRRVPINIEDFFSNVEDGYNLFSDSEEYLDISKSLYKKSLIYSELL